MIISRHLKPSAISLNLSASDISGVLAELAELIAAESDGLNAGKLHTALLEREELLSTASGLGLAFPHCYQNVRKPRFALGIHRTGITSDAPDSRPVQIFLAVISPDNKPEVHLEALSAASRVFIDESIRTRVMEAETEEEVLELVARAEKSGD